MGDGAESLPQVIAPFRQIVAFFLVFGHVTAFAVGRKEPIPGLLFIEGPTNAHRANQTTDHGVRKRDIECFDLAALRSGYVQDTGRKIDMLDRAFLIASGRWPESSMNRWNSRRTGFFKAAS
ncbi:hypothetical protein [Mesorhizobium humile]|uniref:Uncharacterized protein n=1 Tax=Mesorhizobium humile TaxID=3072313 RepID=A0ABU4YQF5_9HYPH|nr:MULTISPECIES: hypothetical protein [unclassified Mesorhizobium]MDX8457907.1 hypothetical protein [Mesorhizobium sp. VK2D]MDX8487987.1 hypothetical protein [Mesorhizobium sp. VK2B]